MPTSFRIQTVRSLLTDIPNSDCICPQVSNAPAKSNSFCKTRISLPQTGQLFVVSNNRIINSTTLGGNRAAYVALYGTVRVELMETKR